MQALEMDSMGWVRLEDDFYEHPKFDEVPPASGWLWLKAIAYCNRFGTDGVISRRKLTQLWGKKDLKRALDPLIAAHLIEPVEGASCASFALRNYLKYQPSAADIAEKKEKKRTAGQKGGLAKAKQLLEGAAKQNCSTVVGQKSAPNPTQPNTNNRSSGGNSNAYGELPQGDGEVWAHFGVPEGMALGDECTSLEQLRASAAAGGIPIMWQPDAEVEAEGMLPCSKAEIDLAVHTTTSKCKSTVARPLFFVRAIKQERQRSVERAERRQAKRAHDVRIGHHWGDPPGSHGNGPQQI